MLHRCLNRAISIFKGQPRGHFNDVTLQPLPACRAPVCISSCLSAPLQGFVGLSIRVKGLLWNGSLSRVYDDPRRDENANAYAYPRLCVRRKKQALRPKMASLFALLLLRGRFIKMHGGPGCMHVCKTVCRGIGMPSPRAISG